MTELIVAIQPGIENAAAVLSELAAGYQVRPLFAAQASETGTAWASGLPAPDRYYAVECTGRELNRLLERLRVASQVAFAYVTPLGRLPLSYDPNNRPRMPPRPALQRHPHPRPQHSPFRIRTEPTADAAQGPPTEAAARLLTDFQHYLDEPPRGIGARRAAADRKPGWEQPGGRGDRVKIIDLEHAWNFSHEDLQTAPLSMIGTGVMHNQAESRHHGTAVAGILVADNNDFGIVGIVPDAEFQAISPLSDPSSTSGDKAGAIVAATAALQAGDVLLIELAGVDEVTGLRLPLEYWPHLATAIASATAKGVIVVQAAGNSGTNLDNISPPHDPFSAAAPTGAVLVGAGYSFSTGEDDPLIEPRERIPNSNYGRRIDAQGWGDLVVTAGYGRLSGEVEDEFYTNVFNGTSSAAAIVAGAIALVQSRRKAEGKAVLTPAQVRTCLRESGSDQPEPGRTNEPIGKLPDVTDPIWMT